MQLKPSSIRSTARREDGFTLIFALIVLFIGGLLVAGAFAAVNGDVDVTRRDTSQKKAYYAALAGIEQYKARLNNSEKYWFTCPKGTNVKLTGTTDETYSYKTLPATGHTSCEAKNQLSVIEGPGAASGTFRIESTGTSGGAKRSIVATFAHPGFTNYVYFSNYEVEDPTTFEPEPANCEHYYKYRVEHKLTDECEPIQFAAKDKVNGPLHTNDAADLCAEGSSKPTFGRNSEDSIEMNGGHYSENGCGNSYSMLGTYTEKAQTLLPPSTDEELLESAGYKFKGKTTIVLTAGVSGNPDSMTVTTEGKSLPAKPFPTNGVVYVENAEATCNIKYTPFGTDYENDGKCGNVYVSGSYTEPLTIAAANDVIVNGSITTTSGTGGKPTGSGTLGLIATNFVRIYHPVKKGYAPETEAPAHPLQTPINKKCIKSVKTISAKLSTSSTTITNITSTSGLEGGDEVTGTDIPAGTTIVSKTSTTLTLSKKPTANVTSESLTIYRATGYEYYSGIEKCVEPAPNNFTYSEGENLFVEECESGTATVGTTLCKYENNSKRCSSKATNLTGSMTSPTIDAAILSTQHSFIVDNFKCGAQLGELNVWGSIAQFWRGPVGTGGSSTGYIKNYNYDDRLATAQPPEFLSSTTSWRLSRETAPPNGFG
jgi:type II secretory pathway pseudopilin PulG